MAPVVFITLSPMPPSGMPAFQPIMRCCAAAGAGTVTLRPFRHTSAVPGSAMSRCLLAMVATPSASDYESALLAEQQLCKAPDIGVHAIRRVEPRIGRVGGQLGFEHREDANVVNLTLFPLCRNGFRARRLAARRVNQLH